MGESISETTFVRFSPRSRIHIAKDTLVLQKGSGGASVVNLEHAYTWGLMHAG